MAGRPPMGDSAPAPAAADGGDARPAPERDLLRAARERAAARFTHLYESRDGALCLFEDEHGHLQAVDSSRLA